MNNANKNGLLSAALAYAREGFAVFPLMARGKYPLVSKKEGGRGYKDATTEEEVIRSWYAKEPNANIGLVTGGINKVFVLDVDGKQGEKSLDDLIEKHGPLPETVEVLTGKGRHLYFQLPGERVRCSASRLSPGLDIRAEGGYAVAPPSIHENGNVYDGEVIREKIAEAPQWLLDLVVESRSIGTQLANKHKASFPSRLPEGSRNEGMARFAGHLRHKGLGGAELLDKIGRASCRERV